MFSTDSPVASGLRYGGGGELAQKNAGPLRVNQLHYLLMISALVYQIDL